MRLKNKENIKKHDIDIDNTKTFFDYEKSDQEKMYDLVREYLYENQGANAIQVSEATGVPRNIIMTFVRQGRVSIVEGTGRLLKNCRICGGVIETGDICPECKRSLMADYNSIDTPQKKNISGYTSDKTAVNKKYGHRRFKNR